MMEKTIRLAPVKYREELTRLPLTPAWESLNPPNLTDIHIPQMHSKALSPEVAIVEGMRGAGKSFWTAILADDKTRDYVRSTAKIASLSNLVVRVGFGLNLDDEQFPSGQSILSLRRTGCTPDDIWRSVLLRQSLQALGADLPFGDSLQEAALWTHNQRDEANRLLSWCDRSFHERNQVFLLLFDSLERLATDWTGIRELLSVALQLGLECRTRRCLRCKFFLRPDMVEQDDAIWRFADSSKLLHGKVELAWRPHDLFGLIVLHLANSTKVGLEFRQELSSLDWAEVQGVYPLPASLTMAEEQPLRSIIEALAGPWVGTSAKRGFTFKWIPTHLSDAKGRLSPRSIMLAFRRAAEWTQHFRPGHSNAVHFEGTQQGVVEASKIRIGEIKEDYPWVGPLLEALKGATVPLEQPELLARWTPPCVRAALETAQSTQRLPPRRFSGDPEKLEDLVEDLVELAVLYRSDDRRLNMPDIFRVGFGIKRRGGVRPPK